jgi:CRP-like cAMP-binding protein
MISIDDFEDIRLLATLSDEMKTKLLPHFELKQFDHREIVFKGGESADVFYMLKRGKILLEQRVSSNITISIGAIKPGYSFGWSAALGGGIFTLDAVCAEPSQVIAVKGDVFKNILDEDPKMGYQVMQKLVEIIKRRLDLRTTQFLKIITRHPDIRNLVDDDQE